MSDVIFTRPFLSHEEMYDVLSFAGPTEPSLGLCYLAAVTRQAGFATEILDALPLKLGNRRLAEMILSKRPKYVGISAVTISVSNAAELAREIKQKDPDITVILGGVHVTALPQETMKRFPVFDAAVLGEGEETVVEILSALEKKRDLREVAGLALRDSDGSVFLTRQREFIRDLDRLPMPAWDLLPEIKRFYRAPAWTLSYEPSGLLILTRGCSAQCIYCDRGAFGDRVRAHSAEYALKLIKDLYHNYGIRLFRILDDNFMLNRTRLKDLCNLIVESGLKIEWTCFARADHVNPEILSLMCRAGCRQISYGVETGSQELHDLEHKNITLETIERGIRWTKEAGMRTVGFVMIGHPEETKDTIEETVRFCGRLALDDFKMMYLTPYPATQLYREAEKYGTLNRDWKSMNAYKYPCFVPYGLTGREIVRYRSIAYRRFYLRPKIIIAYLKQLKRPKQFFVFLRGAFGLLRMWLTK